MTQKQRILNLLRERGKQGVMVYEIMTPRPTGLGVAQYNSRIKELREQGYNIVNKTPGHFVLEDDVLSEINKGYNMPMPPNYNPYIIRYRLEDNNDQLHHKYLEITKWVAAVIEQNKAEELKDKYNEALMRIEALEKVLGDRGVTL